MRDINKKYNVAIVGSTGAVGLKIISLLEERRFPVNDLKLFASSTSLGKAEVFNGNRIMIESLKNNSFENSDIVFFSAGSDISKRFAKSAVDSGAIVIDNSSAFRNVDDIPLVIPEINPFDADRHKGIISNPNCTTAIMLTVLYPLYQEFGIKRIIVSTYQSVSGAGQKGIEELNNQIRDISKDTAPENMVFPYQIAYNVIPHIDSFTENGYTGEELKMLNETCKILHDENIKVSATCVRIPVVSVHSMSVTIETSEQASISMVRELLERSPGVKLFDDPAELKYPMPLISEGVNNCFVGRIRKDSAIDRGISMWICGDQLLKGAALNSVQIAELIISKRIVR